MSAELTTPKRNEAVARFSPHKGVCVRETAGRYVLYSDYEALQGEVSRLRAAIESTLEAVSKGNHPMTASEAILRNALANFNLEPPTDGR